MTKISGSQAALVQRAKQNDPVALTEIYDRHQPAIYRYVYYRVGDTATAEDLTSQVFVRMVEKIDTFTYRGQPILAWLYTIARNLIIDHQRRAGRMTMLPLDERLATEENGMEQAAERALAQRRLAAALAHLTKDQRQVILLKFIEGLDNKQTAQMLGKPVGAVKSLQHRALAALQRVFERNETGLERR